MLSVFRLNQIKFMFSHYCEINKATVIKMNLWLGFNKSRPFGDPRQYRYVQLCLAGRMTLLCARGQLSRDAIISLVSVVLSQQFYAGGVRMSVTTPCGCNINRSSVAADS